MGAAALVLAAIARSCSSEAWEEVTDSADVPSLPPSGVVAGTP
jgi:hypothetical protein